MGITENQEILPTRYDVKCDRCSKIFTQFHDLDEFFEAFGENMRHYLILSCPYCEKVMSQ